MTKVPQKAKRSKAQRAANGANAPSGDRNATNRADRAKDKKTPVKQKSGTAKRNQLAVTKLPKAITKEKQKQDIVIDDDVLVGQYTRAKRFTAAVLAQFGSEVIPNIDGDIKLAPDEQGVDESKFIPANNLRSSKNTIQLIRYLAQTLLAKEFQRCRLFLKANNRETLTSQHVHAMRMMDAVRFIQTAPDADIKSIMNDAVEDIVGENAKEGKAMSDKNWAEVDAVGSLIGIHSKSEYADVLGQKRANLHYRQLSKKVAKQKAIKA